MSQLLAYYLQNIKANHHLNAFAEVFVEEAKDQASLIDQKIARGEAGKLAGLVVGIKDLFNYAGHRMQAASKILEGYVAPYHATALERLLQADALIIGRQNCDEFGMGSANENSVYGPVHNPLNPLHSAGGSSGGSAAAVAAQMCQLSLASDTGGSVRQPAAFCGLLGLKPGYGRISRHGLTAYASSFDCVGLIGQYPEDLAQVLEVIAGPDEWDSTASPYPLAAYTGKLSSVSSKKIAFFEEILDNGEGLQPEVKDAFLAKIAQLEEQGYQVEGIKFPLLPFLLPVYYLLTTAEASSNLARYDGIRYGFRSELQQAELLDGLYKKTRAEGFGKEVKRRLILGTFVLSANYFDAYYQKAQKVRRQIREATQQVLRHYDFIISPTTPSTAFELGKPRQNPVEMYLEDIFTVQANVTGIPAISLPIAYDARGLPIGLQVMANFEKEYELLAFAKEQLEDKKN
ncbi:MAG: Asp-tRNA(Asn)/Glu-tRNA(Gln) amidotransferase subunit GatA [Microscillaceae bacterium]|nr:Asp-tRNA(Asn)/Glu-tRNA(Gln) amidotransferase subunit GatA [Microscillaceae bacterium]